MRITIIVITLSISSVALASDSDDVAKLVDSEFSNLWITSDLTPFFTPEAQFVQLMGLVTPDMLGMFTTGPSAGLTGHHEESRQIVFARDGKTAWVSLTEHIKIAPEHGKDYTQSWRVSQIAVKTAVGWRIAIASWSLGVANDDVNKRAKAGQLKNWLVPLGDDAGDTRLRNAFVKLTTDGVDATAAARQDLLAIGSGPGERTLGGAAFAKAWAAAWVHHVTIASSIARIAPSGTTGWVAANLTLEKGTGKAAYKIPFLVFCVFDKTTTSDWSLMQIQFSVP